MKVSILVLLLGFAWPNTSLAKECAAAVEPWAQVQRSWSLSWQYPASGHLYELALKASDIAGMPVVDQVPLRRQRTELFWAWNLSLLSAVMLAGGIFGWRRGRTFGFLVAGTFASMSMLIQLQGADTWHVTTRSTALRTAPNGSIAATTPLPVGVIGICSNAEASNVFCFWQGRDSLQGWVEDSALAKISADCEFD